LSQETPSAAAFVVDCLQYCAWSRRIFLEMRAGGVDAVHATIAYHENFRETVDRLIATRTRKGRIVAVGTTVVRTLESASQSGKLVPYTGTTNLFVRPPYNFHAVDALLTSLVSGGATKHPDGQLSKTCQALRIKRIRFTGTETQCRVCPSHPIRGACARHERAVGCGGRHHARDERM